MKLLVKLICKKSSVNPQFRENNHNRVITKGILLEIIIIDALKTFLKKAKKFFIISLQMALV